MKVTEESLIPGEGETPNPSLIPIHSLPCVFANIYNHFFLVFAVVDQGPAQLDQVG